MANPTTQPINVGDNIAQSWEAFKHHFKFHLRSIGKDTATTKVRAVLLVNVVGEPFRAELRRWNIPDATYDDCELLETLIEQKIKPSAKPHVSTMLFRNRVRKAEETIDDYIKTMEELVKPCGYSELPTGESIENRVILDQIMLNLKDPTLLLSLTRTDKLTLRKARETIKVSENSLAQVKRLQNGKLRRKNQKFPQRKLDC